MNISKVTMTGADDSIYPEQLTKLSTKFPYVEWGILLSSNSEGKNRFPSLEWMEELKVLENNIQISGHICGKWIRDLLVGKNTFVMERPSIFDIFQRFQLNFHAEDLTVDPNAFMRAVQTLSRGREIIFQLDGKNNNLIKPFMDKKMYVAGLYDVSHGAGVLPSSWPKKITGINMGLAGGLGPDNLAEQLERMAESIGNNTIWIDMETKIRSNGDKIFDLNKVEECLELCKKWIE